MSYQDTELTRSVGRFKGSPHANQRIFHLCLALSDQFHIRKVLMMLWLDECIVYAAFSVLPNVYLSLCSFVHEFINIVWWSPAHFLCMCVVFPQTWVLLHPADTLIFHHTLCYTVNVCTLSCSLSIPLDSSTSPILLLSHHINHPPLTPTHTSNQSKDRSRLALEKTPWRHLFILTIFRYTFSSPSFFPPHSFEFLTSLLNKRCSHPRGERKVGGRVSNEGEEKAGEAEGKRLSLNMLSHLSHKTSTLYA